MEPKELKLWFEKKEALRFKEKETDLLFDAMLSPEEDDSIVLHQCNETDQIWVLSLDEFCDLFEETLSSQP